MIEKATTNFDCMSPPYANSTCISVTEGKEMGINIEHIEIITIYNKTVELNK